MKKVFKLSSLFLIGLLFGACSGGGGGGSAALPLATTASGTGYYVDSPVDGAEFKCGAFSGVTDSDGKFTFEKGKDCSFSLAGIKLRDVNASMLGDGVTVVETNATVAAFLQSLDRDGNASNGIELSSDVVAALVDALNSLHIAEVPSDFILSGVIGVIGRALGDDYNGTVVDETKAREHLEDTMTTVTTELLAGKTFYTVVEKDGEYSIDSADAKVTFDANATHVTDDNNITEHIVIGGNKMICPNDGSYTIIEQHGAYILGIDYYADGTYESKHYLFTTEAAAQAYYNSVRDDDTPSEAITRFSTEYLNGKTLYFVQYDDFGYDSIGEKWNMAKMVFTTSSFTWLEYNTPDTDVHTFNYTITDDGKISYSGGDFGDDFDTGTISFASVEDDYLKVCIDGDCNTYMFFDETKAQEFVDSHNGDSVRDDDTPS